MSDKETIGYHKGSLESLLKEKAELSRLLNIVNSLVEKHYKALEETGVDVEKFINSINNEKQKKSQNRRESRRSQRRKRRKDRKSRRRTKKRDNDFDF